LVLKLNKLVANNKHIQRNSQIALKMLANIVNISFVMVVVHQTQILQVTQVFKNDVCKNVDGQITRFEIIKNKKTPQLCCPDRIYRWKI